MYFQEQAEVQSDGSSAEAEHKQCQNPVVSTENAASEPENDESDVSSGIVSGFENRKTNAVVVEERVMTVQSSQIVSTDVEFENPALAKGSEHAAIVIQASPGN